MFIGLSSLSKVLRTNGELTLDSTSGSTNTEPGAVATGFNSAKIQQTANRSTLSQVQPGATAPGSVFLEPQCKRSESIIDLSIR